MRGQCHHPVTFAIILAYVVVELSSIQKCSKLSENVFVLKHSSQLFLAAKLQNQVRFIAKCCIKDYNSTVSMIELPCFISQQCTSEKDEAMPTHHFTFFGDTPYMLPRPTPAKTTRLPKETKVYFNPFFITFYLLVVFRGTKIVNLSETAQKVGG